MKKQRLQLIVLLAALVSLALAFLWIRQYNKTQQQKDSLEEPDGEMVIDTSYEDVVKLSYDYDGQNFAFEKEDGVWYVADDHSLNVKETMIKAMLSGLTPLTAEQAIENAAELGQYGLDEPKRTIAYETASASYILYVGDNNSLTGTYYVKMPSDSTVYAVEQTVITRLNKTLEDVVETQEEETGESDS